jgi:hypothetical protein
VIDNPGPAGHRDKQKCAGELDDQPDPQRPGLGRVVVKPDEIAALQRRSMLLVRIACRLGQAGRTALGP